ncbi:glutamyl-tRNA reductase [Clostridium pascui]|uniref:hypothetical protein n=1 Tax=Clostridium pascui TaxID=46609 RepID=UPI00195C2F71|nr:hypothetical protein [Clostridium pascui]MBM7870458.1 glutamyl-tRNA reductase [Clostridium pascui]
MRSKKLMVKVMTGLIAAGLTLSAGISASAKSDDAAASNGKLTITQGKVGNKRAISSENIKTQLESLVESGTITKEQSDKITEFINAQKEERKAEMEKVKNMTVEERKAYFESQKDTKKTDIFKTLVDNGVISQDQADKIKASFPQEKDSGKRFGYKIKVNSEGLKTTLDALVGSGGITQAKEDKIISFMNEKSETMKAEMEKVKNMTEDERKAYFESKKDTERIDIFKELVDNGTLTQTEVDAIKAAMPKMERVKDKKEKIATDTNTTGNQSGN